MFYKCSLKLSVHAPVLCIEKGLNPNMLKYQNDVNSGVVSMIVLTLILLAFFVLFFGVRISFSDCCTYIY